MKTNPAIRAAARKPKTKTQIAFERRQAWIDAVQCRRDLSPSARMIGSRLGSHQNLKTGQCNPGIRTLATEAAIAERSAFRAIVELERKGWIKVARSRGGRMSDANGYKLIMPKAAATAATESAVKRADNDDMSPLTLCQPNLEEELRSEGGASTKHPPSPGERDDHYRDLDSSIASGRAALAAAAEAFEERPEPASPPEPEAGTLEPAASPHCQRRVDDDSATPSTNPLPEDDGAHAAWRALVELWRRGHPADDTPKAIAIARVAFVKAIAEGTAPETIVAAAKVWIAAADAPRFLPQLATWLSSRGFEQKPPPKRERRSNKARRDQLPRQNGKVDLTTLTLKRAGYVEDENGNLYHPDGDTGSAFWWARASS